MLPNRCSGVISEQLTNRVGKTQNAFHLFFATKRPLGFSVFFRLALNARGGGELIKTHFFLSFIFGNGGDNTLSASAIALLDPFIEMLK